MNRRRGLSIVAIAILLGVLAPALRGEDTEASRARLADADVGLRADPGEELVGHAEPNEPSRHVAPRCAGAARSQQQLGAAI